MQAARAHHEAGRLAQAEAGYQQVLAAQPGHPYALNLLGALAGQTGHHAAAADLIRQAITHKPNDAWFHSNLGEALRALGRFDEAIISYRRALVLRPDYADALSNLGNALTSIGQLDEAVACLKRALELQPELAQAHSNVGVLLDGLGRFDEAVAYFRRALALQPGVAMAHYNLGNVQMHQRALDDAEASYSRALALRPDYVEANSNLGNILAAQVRLDEALASYRRAVALAPNDPGVGSNVVYTLHFHPDYDAQALLAEHRAWAQHHETPRQQFRRPHANAPDPDRLLHIGYVSPDLCDHPVFRFLLPLLEHHDRSRFSITCYSDAVRPDAATARLRAHVNRWHTTTGWAEERLAEQIRADGIDILVDLALHTGGNRQPVFARKPAPVQVSWLGLPGTTGLEAMDYRLTDPYLDPPGRTATTARPVCACPTPSGATPDAKTAPRLILCRRCRQGM